MVSRRGVRVAAPWFAFGLLVGWHGLGGAQTEDPTGEDAIELEEAQESAEPVTMPEPPPDFELRSPQGKPLKLSQLRKPVTVLFAWAPDCAPCVGQLGLLQALYERLRADRTLAVVSVAAVPSGDAAALKTVLQVAREKKLLMPMAVDHERQLTSWLSQAATAEDGRRVSWILPLLVVADKDFHVYHVWGLSPETARNSWLDEVVRVVGLAKKGELPDSPPMPAGLAGEAPTGEEVGGEVPPEGSGEGGPEAGPDAEGDGGPDQARFPFPRKLAKQEIDERLPIYRDYLREQYSRLTREQLEALMAEFRKQLEEGRSEVVLIIPAGVSEAKDAP